MNSFAFEPIIAEDDSLVTAKYQTPFGLSRTVIVRLGDEPKFLVYSPGAPLLEQAQSIIGQNAEVILMAPSLGHTLGMASWLKAYPEARLTATEKTREKLASQGLTQLNFCEPEAIHLETPHYLGIFRLPECTSGELWVTLLKNHRTYWLACDGVMNLSALSDNLIKRTLQRLYGLRLGLRVTPTFKSNITNKEQFSIWFKTWLEKAQAPVLVPCHGDVYFDDDLHERLIQLFEH